jgi:hypothetical protein
LSALADRLDEIAAAGDNRRGPNCGVCTLPEELLAQVRRGWYEKSPRMTGSQLARFLRGEGLSIQDGTILRHFKLHEDR